MTSERAPYVRFFPTDWKAGVAGLPPLVEWTYLQICVHNWDKGQPLPEALFEIVLGRNPDWRRDLDLLVEHLGKIERTMGGAVFSKRALAEARLAQDSLEKRRKGGRKGAQKRWNDSNLDGSPNGIPNGNQNQNQNQTSSSDDVPPVPPGGEADLFFKIDPAAMADFREHRRKIRAPMTDRAEALIVKKLEALHEQGHDPTAVLHRSIENGWRGVFPPDGEQDGRRKAGARGPDRRDGFTSAVHDEAFDDSRDGQRRLAPPDRRSDGRS